MLTRTTHLELPVTLAVTTCYVTLGLWIDHQLVGLAYPEWYVPFALAHITGALDLWWCLVRELPAAGLALACGATLGRWVDGRSPLIIVVALSLWFAAPLVQDLLGETTLRQECYGLATFWPAVLSYYVTICTGFLIGLRMSASASATAAE